MITKEQNEEKKSVHKEIVIIKEANLFFFYFICALLEIENVSLLSRSCMNKN